MDIESIVVTNDEGRQFTVVLIRTDDRSPYNDYRGNDEPTIEFYDRTYAGERFTPAGQFVSAYYVATLTDDETGLREWGLDLQGDVPVWKIDGAAMSKVFDWLETTL